MSARREPTELQRPSEGLIEQTRAALLSAHHEAEASLYLPRMRALLARDPLGALSGRALEAHFTASAFLLRADGAPLALYHKKLQRWLQPGGHIEWSDRSPLDAALREAREETGLLDLKPLSPHPIDLDIHRIPERGAHAAHDHYDLRFGFLVGELTQRAEAYEPHRLEWLEGQALSSWLEDPSLSRAYRRARQLIS